MLSSSSDPQSQLRAPGIKNVLGAFILDIVLLATFWFFGMMLATMAWTLNENFFNAGQVPNTQPGQFASMLMGVSALYFSIVALWFLRGRELFLHKSTASGKSMLILAAGTGFAVFLLTTCSTYVLAAAGVELQPGNQDLLENIGKQWPIIIALFTITTAPVFEELLFRKQIFARFARSGFEKTGYFASSLAFALMHEPQPAHGILRWLLVLGLYGAMGGAFAWIYLKTGRLWPAILAHAANNLFAVSTLFIGLPMS